MAGTVLPLTYSNIMELYRKEQNSTDVVEIRKDFYPALREFIDLKKKESEEEIRKDPYSIKASSMANEIKKVTQKGNQIFQFRLKKILLMALREANGAKLDTTKLTDEEKRLFEDVTERLRMTKALAMEGQEFRPMTSLVAGDSVCGMTASNEQGSASAQTNGVSMNVLVRILDDDPSLLVGSKTYRLYKEDIVSLPASIGCTLVKNGKAVEVVPSLNRA